jgi:hypothetical protein
MVGRNSRDKIDPFIKLRVSAVFINAVVVPVQP